MKLRILALSIAVISTACTLKAGAEGALADSAKFYYGEGEFEKAIMKYEAILDLSLESANLYFNIGNAYYKLENYPKAILNYERALLLEPKNEDVLFNLSKAQAYIIDDIDVLPEFFLSKWAKNSLLSLTSNAWSFLSLTLFFLTACAFVLFFLSKIQKSKRLGFYLGSLMLIISIFSYIAAAKTQKHILDSQSAIIMTPTVTVKGSPSLEGVSVFIIHEGTKVYLLRDLDDWFEIRLSDGKQGWLKKSDIEKI